MGEMRPGTTCHLSPDDICVYCNRPALKECGSCAMPYCSRRCQLQDYNRHRPECTVPPLVDRIYRAHLGEILKEHNAMRESQECRTKVASNKPCKKNKRKKDKSNKHSTVSRNDKNSKDSCPSQRDGTKKNNIAGQSRSESSRNGREKDIPSATDLEQKLQEVGNSRAAREKVEDSESTRESTADAGEGKQKRKLPSDRFTEVIITVPEGPVTYWVQLRENIEMSLDVYEAVSTMDASGRDSCEPKIGELYIAPFQGNWYRAKVISLQPKLKVLFVDYGNEDICSRTDIKKLPESCKSIPHLAFRIKLVPGTSRKYHNLNADMQLQVKPVGSVKENDAVVVCVKGDILQSESAVKYKYALQKLKEGEHGIGKIIKHLSEEDTLILMSTESTKEEYLKVKHLDELVPQLSVDDFKPKIGDFVAAEAEERGLLDCQWGRAVILGVDHDKYLVHFVDHCVVLRSKNIRKLPREVADIPEFGSKLTILEYKVPVNGNWTQFFKTEGKFPFTVEEVNRNKIVTVAINKGEEKVCRAISSGWDPIFDPNTVCLKNGTEVIIVFFDLEFIYVRPVSISYMQMFDDLEEDLCKYCETASQLRSMPSLMSVVACKYGQNSTYYRVQVIDICKDMVKVYFVDYGNEAVVKLENLKSLSENVRLYPFLAEKIPLKHITKRDLNAEGTRLLLELSEEKTKLKVKWSNDVLSGIEMIMENGITLNKKFETIFTEKEKRQLAHDTKKEITRTSSPLTDKIYLMDVDLKFEGLPVGETVELLVLKKLNETAFTCCRRDSTALLYSIGTLQEEITAYCNKCEEAYRPKEMGELCLARFEDYGMWYRAVCLEKTDNSAQQVKVVYIDYGNIADVAISHIRRMVAEYLKIPAVANLCRIKGSEHMSEAKKDAIASLVKVSGTYPASIIEQICTSYVVEMLHVTKALSSMN